MDNQNEHIIKTTNYLELSQADQLELRSLIDTVQHGIPYFDPPKNTADNWGAYLTSLDPLYFWYMMMKSKLSDTLVP